jgi:biotin carboxyl carrier protein
MMFEATVDGRTFKVEVRANEGRYTVVLDERPLEVDLQEAGPHFASLLVGGESHSVGLAPAPGGFTVVVDEDVFSVELQNQAHGGSRPRPKAEAGPLKVTAPMPGKLVRVLVLAGQEIAAGQGLVVVEAMKMENELRAPRAGRVKELLVKEGQAVETGALLAVVE